MAAPVTLRQWLLRDEPFDCAMNPTFLGVFTHLGCMGALQREGLLRHLCGLAGTSAGAMAGSVLASGKTVLEPGTAAPHLHPDMDRLVSLGNRRWEILDPGLGFGLLKGDGIEAEQARFCAADFRELPVPFACTAWSAAALRTEVLHRGSLPRAVRASSTVPGLLQPSSHDQHRWLFDGGIGDPSGSKGLSVLPQQPQRSLHVVVNRFVALGLDYRWTQAVGPSRFGARRREVLTLRLNRPPALLLGDASFRVFDQAILHTAQAVLNALDLPLQKGSEEGHWILELDVGWTWEAVRRTSRHSRL